jgi:PTH1 family peptidyl-tRNA hydrolase
MVWLIVGLGNPGRRYQGNRHNLGFMAVERLARDLPAGTTRSRMAAELLETRRAIAGSSSRNRRPS